jgi:hypothetical protein
MSDKIKVAVVIMVLSSRPMPAGSEHCLMSMNIREKEVRGLTMELFKAKVKWEQGALQIVNKSGIVQTILSPNFTIKSDPR